MLLGFIHILWIKKRIAFTWYEIEHTTGKKVFECIQKQLFQNDDIRKSCKTQIFVKYSLNALTCFFQSYVGMKRRNDNYKWHLLKQHLSDLNFNKVCFARYGHGRGVIWPFIVIRDVTTFIIKSIWNILKTVLFHKNCRSSENDDIFGITTQCKIWERNTRTDM